MKHRTVTVAIQHRAGMTAANAVKVKQCKLVDFNAVYGSTFKHRDVSQISLDQKNIQTQELGRG
jgi:hypothetical protein